MATVIIPANTNNHISAITQIEKKGRKSILFLGSLQAALDNTILKEYKIASVLTVAVELNVQLSNSFSCKKISVQDNVFQNLGQYFSETNQFIGKALEKGNVLVHCRAGISRSATVVLAFLMKQKRYKLKRALQKVVKNRPIIKPNEGFMNQLKEYQRKLSKMLQAKNIQLK